MIITNLIIIKKVFIPKPNKNMMSFSKAALKTASKVQRTAFKFNQAPVRSFGAMDQINKDLFEHEFTSEMNFQKKFDKIKCFRVMNEEGDIVTPGYDTEISDELLLKMYDTMVTMNEADSVYNAAQRQARISFYMTQLGEEASGIGSAAALDPKDLIFPQYREAGAFLWRGFSIQQMGHQLTGNQYDLGQGKQMPIHYGSRDLNIVTVSSPLATQLPQASGAGYNFRIKGEDRIAVTYVGEGACSEGDFHGALNFAATLRAQTLFYVRNNGYAISTPIDDQYAGDGIAVRGIAYGMPTIRVDGNDLLAIYFATKYARKMIIEEKCPVLIEAISYRVGDHSTSDFSQRYRDEEEMKKWTELLEKFSSPIQRMENYLTKRGLINEERTKATRKDALNQVRNALKAATGELLPEVDQLFEQVYEEMPTILKDQR